MELEHSQHLDQSLGPGTQRGDSLGGQTWELLLAVGQWSGDHELPLATDGHTVQSLVPTFDDLSSTEDEREWGTGSVGIELLAVGEFTNVPISRSVTNLLSNRL